MTTWLVRWARRWAAAWRRREDAYVSAAWLRNQVKK